MFSDCIEAITNVVFKTHEIPQYFYCGTIVAPRSALAEAIPHISRFSASKVDPGVSCFMFIEKNKFQTMHDIDVEEHDALVLNVFDANGEEHGRQTFDWALKLPGAQDFTRMRPYLDVIRMQGLCQFSSTTDCRFTITAFSDYV